MSSPALMKAWILNNCMNGRRTTLNVPSTNHVLALARMSSWCWVAKTMCRCPSMLISATRKPGGMKSSCSWTNKIQYNTSKVSHLFQTMTLNIHISGVIQIVIYTIHYTTPVFIHAFILTTKSRSLGSSGRLLCRTLLIILTRLCWFGRLASGADGLALFRWTSSAMAVAPAKKYIGLS